MTPDIDTCAALVRTIADRLAAAPRPQGGPRSLETIITEVRAISRAAEDEMRARLAALYPDIGWTGEEDAPAGADSWLYDPIDGAYHYLQHLPLWSSSLVLVRGGRAVMAIVYDPSQNELFTSVEGAGAACNGAPVHVSARTDLSAAVVGTAVPPVAQVGEAAQRAAMDVIGAVARDVFVVRPMAAASLQLAYVAAGRLDAYWEAGQDPADWLAGSLIVREAGGSLTALDGTDFGVSADGILAAPSQLHPALLTTIGAC